MPLRAVLGVRTEVLEELLRAHASNLGARSTLDINALLDQV